ncbi:MAG: 16S rRNA (cytidine(1402)-2'-O)-methyltransferase [Desulfobacterales bacterium]|nr:MAG: 16S rRNA (cytidine(1402)-2'-O)-methyltransferase [Desulfobacterales bacterium]
MSLTHGKLWVVATPLGNLGDMSPRGTEILASAALILAEDTRRAGLLCQRLGISHRRMVSAFDHNESSRISLVLATLSQGDDVALISDAGTPLIADPGYVLVTACRQAGYEVSPVPGPCAPLAALMACGLPTTPFTFLGFLPRRPGHIRAALAPYAAIQTTLVFFERKNRLAASLPLAHEVLGPRPYCVARELTKVHEEFILGTLGHDEDQALDALEEIKGECTVVIGPGMSSPQPASVSQVLSLLAEEGLQGGKPKAVARRVAARLEGWTPKEVYALHQGRYQGTGSPIDEDNGQVVDR